MNALTTLQQILQSIKNTFVGKDEIIDVLGIALIAKENAFLLGPPGTAKSAIVRQLSHSIEGGKNFEYLLTRFTEPNEIFGPFDIRKLKEGELVTNTQGMLPEASMVFLDEIFNANSAILNSLLMALNERLFRRGKETQQLPTLMFVGASNQLPEDEALNALLDRFLLRLKCDYVAPDLLGKVLVAGWNLEQNKTQKPVSITPEAIQTLQEEAKKIDLNGIREQFVQLIYAIRNAGINVSDRRAVKIQNLLAASALICGRSEAITADFWIMKYIWDTEEQIEVLAGIVDTIIQQEKHPQAHPQAFVNTAPNPEQLMAEIQALNQQWNTEKLSFETQNLIKDQLRHLQTRCNWINDQQQQAYLQEEIEKLWKTMLKTL